MTRRLAIWLAAHGALALLSLLAFLPHWGRGLQLDALGDLSFFADQIGRGRAAGLDFAVHGLGPGRYGLVRSIQGVFDAPFLPSAFAAFLWMRVLTSALVLEIGLRVLPGDRRPWIALPIACVLLAPGPLVASFLPAGSLALTLALLAYVESPERRTAFAFGLLLPAVALFRLDLGLYGLIVFAFAALGDRSRWPHLAVAYTPLAVGLALTAWTMERQAPGSWTAAAAQALAAGLADLPGVAEGGAPGPLDGALLSLPLVIYSGLLLALLRTARWGFDVDPLDRRRLALLLVFGVLTSGVVLVDPRLGALFVAGPLVWIAAAVLLSRLAHGWPPRATGDAGLPPPPTAPAWGRSVAGMAAGILLATLGVAVADTHQGDLDVGTWSSPAGRTFIIDTRLGRLWLDADEFHQIEPLLEAIDAAPDGPLWVPTDQPLLYGLSGRRDVTGYLGVSALQDAPEREREVVRRLEADPPAVAVVFEDEGGRSFERAAPRLHSYLWTEYEVRSRVGRALVMTRQRPVRTVGLPAVEASP